MDILVVRPDGSWYSRPDVTLVRDRDRFFLPDDCDGALACRCRALRADKAGKAIAPKFFPRYFSEWAQGVLFYGVPAGGEATPLIDRSTWIDLSFHPLSGLPGDETENYARAVASISSRLSIRIGDLICFELEDPVSLRRGEMFENLLVS